MPAAPGTLQFLRIRLFSILGQKKRRMSVAELPHASGRLHGERRPRKDGARTAATRGELVNTIAARNKGLRHLDRRSCSVVIIGILQGPQ